MAWLLRADVSRTAVVPFSLDFGIVQKGQLDSLLPPWRENRRTVKTLGPSGVRPWCQSPDDVFRVQGVFCLGRVDCVELRRELGACRSSDSSVL